MINTKVGLIGGGNMARAIGGGLLRGGMHATDLMIAEPLAEQCELLRKELYGTLVTEDNQRVAADAETLLFAVKPQILKLVCQDLAEVVQESRPLIMSIAAGPQTDDIDTWLGGDLSVVRVMPNQPALIDQGISALFANTRSSTADKEMAEKVENGRGDRGIRHRTVVFLFTDRCNDRSGRQSRDRRCDRQDPGCRDRTWRYVPRCG